MVFLLLTLAAVGSPVAATPGRAASGADKPLAASPTSTPSGAAGFHITPSPNADAVNNTLVAISAVSASDIWAVGDYYDNVFSYITYTLAMRWNGSQWSIVPSPNPGPSDDDLDSISAAAPNDTWAAGRYFDSSNVIRSLTEHWDGSGWSVVPSDIVSGTLREVVSIASGERPAQQGLMRIRCALPAVMGEYRARRARAIGGDFWPGHCTVILPGTGLEY
jgi:hypothetical protein